MSTKPTASQHEASRKAVPHLAVSQVIDAPAAAIYRLLADYRDGHPRILPKPTFAGLVVEEGGIGEGTVIRVTMRVMGSEQTLRMRVSEPEPGRVLVEEDPDQGVYTTFTVEPLAGGDSSRVTIATEWRSLSGVSGWIQGQLSLLVARRLYRRELDLIAEHFRAEKPAPA